MTKEELFQQVKNEHPDWTEEQIWTQISILISAENEVANNSNVNPTEEFIKLVLEKAQEWLIEVLPHIFEKVAKFFAHLLERLPDWFHKGISYVYECITKYFKTK